MEIIKGVNAHLCIGITPNKEEILIKSKASSEWWNMGGYLWMAGNGRFGHNCISNFYAKHNSFGWKGDTLQIRFDWKRHLLHYIVNGKDLGNALELRNCKKLIADESAEYRLAVCFIMT